MVAAWSETLYILIFIYYIYTLLYVSVILRHLTY